MRSTGTPLRWRLQRTPRNTQARIPLPSSSSSSSSSSVTNPSTPSSSTPPSSSPSSADDPQHQQRRRLPLTNHCDVVFTGALSLGTPAQNFTLIFDTGSSDLWILSRRDELQPKQQASSHAYNAQLSATHRRHLSLVPSASASPSSSSSSSSSSPAASPSSSAVRANSSSALLAVDTPWAVEYGEGQASGHLSIDTVHFMGLSLPSHIFGEAQHYSDNFRSQDDVTHGILGLGFSVGSESRSLTLIDHLFQQGLIQRRVFSFLLSSTLSSSPSASHSSASPTSQPLPRFTLYAAQSPSFVPAEPAPESFFILGEADESLAPAGILWSPVQKNEHSGVIDQWLLGVESLHIDNPLVEALCTKCVALLDTGSSFIGLPTRAFIRVRDLILLHRPDCRYDYNRLEIECSDASLHGLPSFELTISSHVFTLRPQHYMTEGIVGIMHIAPREGESELIILGDVFLKTYYTVFDMDAPRIGLSLQSHPLSEATQAPLAKFANWSLIVLACLVVVAFCLTWARSLLRLIHRPSSDFASSSPLPDSIKQQGSSDHVILNLSSPRHQTLTPLLSDGPTFDHRDPSSNSFPISPRSSSYC